MVGLRRGTECESDLSIEVVEGARKDDCDDVGRMMEVPTSGDEPILGLESRRTAGSISCKAHWGIGGIGGMWDVVAISASTIFGLLLGYSE
jgi:hypothetical protein